MSTFVIHVPVQKTGTSVKLVFILLPQYQRLQDRDRVPLNSCRFQQTTMAGMDFYDFHVELQILFSWV